MATRTDLTLYEANDEILVVGVITNQPNEGTALDLFGASVEAFLKVSAKADDSDNGVWKGTTDTGEVLIRDAAGGILEITIPGSVVTTTKGWWRCDVVLENLRKTAVYGSVTVVDL